MDVLIEKWEHSGLLGGCDDLQDKLQLATLCEELFQYLTNNKEYGESFETAPFLVLYKIYKRDQVIDVKELCNEMKTFFKSDMVSDLLSEYYPYPIDAEMELLNLFIEKRLKF